MHKELQKKFFPSLRIKSKNTERENTIEVALDKATFPPLAKKNPWTETKIKDSSQNLENLENENENFILSIKKIEDMITILVSKMDTMLNLLTVLISKLH